MKLVTTETRNCRVLRPGVVEYDEALRLQQRLVASRSRGEGEDTLILLQHPPTITLGNRADRSHVLACHSDLTRHGIQLVQSDRGGDVTYHAPGQIVGYPILKLGPLGISVGTYLRGVEALVIRTLADYGIASCRVPGLTGVWVGGGEAKIAAVGVKFSASGVTSHGFALNLNPDMRGFSQIIPCGISDRGVTSIEQVLGTPPPLAEVEARLLFHFSDVFDLHIDTSAQVRGGLA